MADEGEVTNSLDAALTLAHVYGYPVELRPESASMPTFVARSDEELRNAVPRCLLASPSGGIAMRRVDG